MKGKHLKKSLRMKRTPEKKDREDGKGRDKRGNMRRMGRNKRNDERS